MIDEAEKAGRKGERDRIAKDVRAATDAKLRELAVGAWKAGYKAAKPALGYAFTARDNSNLNAHLDAILSAYKGSEISYGKAHGLLAHLVMLGVNGHAAEAARFVAVSSAEHFKDD